MKTLILTYIIVIFSVKASAMKMENSAECHELKNAHLKLVVYTHNIANAQATRHHGSKGGHYKKKEVVCSENSCKEKILHATRKVYEPGHPDANKRGYVFYPDINPLEELKKINQAVLEISQVAERQGCHTKLQNKANEMVVSYHQGSVIQDIFKFGKDKKLQSWLRIQKNGKQSMVDYLSRIDEQKFATNSFAF
jgi:flagellar basal-body rod protein FlgC